MSRKRTPDEIIAEIQEELTKIERARSEIRDLCRELEDAA